jgi:hypothetical protein
MFTSIAPESYFLRITPSLLRLVCIRTDSLLQPILSSLSVLAAQHPVPDPSPQLT